MAIYLACWEFKLLLGPVAFLVGSLFGLCGLAENYGQFSMKMWHLSGDYWRHVAIVRGGGSEQEAR